MRLPTKMEKSWLDGASFVLDCKVGQTLLTYVGLPISGNPRRLSFWCPLIERIQNRLFGSLDGNKYDEDVHHLHLLPLNLHHFL
ncbi:hypothetical protein MTR_4g074110 [Medicago truncatula]|uniref:Uncharacterized protein n=1 Tax=Medicago truncatula TaxID=3880 RepID=A0A072ULG1_MEDTR|nr:hypothetical protein MTR_4g074110 [Medicago truncatula]